VVGVLVFLAVPLGFLAIVYIINLVRGVRARYIDDWKPDAGEELLFQDMRADIYIISFNRPRYVTYARLRRGAVIVTNCRILCGTRTLFGKKIIFQYILYADGRFDTHSESIDGGLLARGYQTFVYLPHAITRVSSDENPYVDLKPSPLERSSVNVECIRIYTDRASDFPDLQS
jgi:hypothetical protein